MKRSIAAEFVSKSPIRWLVSHLIHRPHHFSSFVKVVIIQYKIVAIAMIWRYQLDLAGPAIGDVAMLTALDLQLYTIMVGKL